MGAQQRVSLRVVFDTTTVVSALLFPEGRLAWLCNHWRSGKCLPLISRETSSEVTRVLAYPKFRLSQEDRYDLLAEYLPFCKVVDRISDYDVRCRDSKDQPFLNLAHSAAAEVLVSGDNDLLVLAGQTEFAIETAEPFRKHFE